MANRLRAALACFLVVSLAAASAFVYRLQRNSIRPDENGVYHVYAGQDIQTSLDAAAHDPQHKRVLVHAGVYRPQRFGQALIWLNEIHDGITLEATGDAVLTAANPDLALKSDNTFPAVVNHVVYFGHGITRKTVLRGFKITGANGYVTTSDATPIETSVEARQHREMLFYTDGGGIKIYGRSCPTIERVEIYDNFASPCGGGVSIEHRGQKDAAVFFKDCIFRNNHCTMTGAAVDVLENSTVEIENCLFVGNLSDTHLDERAGSITRWKPEHGSGALSIFAGSRVVVRNCTFTGNRNGIDDSSKGNRYENCIFWQNTVPGGWPKGRRYELDLADGSGVKDCRLNGDLIDLNGNVDQKANVFGCGDPEFDEGFVARAEGFQGVGYRPAGR